jgi:ribose transport system ATP-binding protein
LNPSTSHVMLHLKDMGKQFGGKIALDRARLTLSRGEILGLVGDNGAGKSTLLKIVSGALKRDAGEIFMEERRVRIDSPVHSRALGIEMVYQDLSLCGSLSVWENVYLGRYETRNTMGGMISILGKRKMTQQTRKILESLGINLLNVNIPVRNLSGGEQQAVAICRCLLFEPRVILLDEPTASMALWEKKKVLALIQTLKDQGRSIIMVTHNLQELFQVADRAVVLKNGRNVWQGPLAGITPDDLARMMFLGKA